MIPLVRRYTTSLVSPLPSITLTRPTLTLPPPSKILSTYPHASALSTKASRTRRTCDTSTNQLNPLTFSFRRYCPSGSGREEGIEGWYLSFVRRGRGVDRRWRWRWLTCVRVSRT